MAYILQFPTFTEYDLITSVCDRNKAITNSPVFTWLMYGKISESITIQPRYTTVSEKASSNRKYIDEVTISAIPTITYSVTLAAAATMTITNSAIGAVTSSDTSVATVVYTDGVATITGVATGSSVITIKDTANDTMYIINVTVS